MLKASDTRRASIHPILRCEPFPQTLRICWRPAATIDRTGPSAAGWERSRPYSSRSDVGTHDPIGQTRAAVHSEEQTKERGSLTTGAPLHSAEVMAPPWPTRKCLDRPRRPTMRAKPHQSALPWRLMSTRSASSRHVRPTRRREIAQWLDAPWTRRDTSPKHHNTLAPKVMGRRQYRGEQTVPKRREDNPAVGRRNFLKGAGLVGAAALTPAAAKAQAVAPKANLNKANLKAAAPGPLQLAADTQPPTREVSNSGLERRRLHGRCLQVARHRLSGDELRLDLPRPA